MKTTLRHIECYLPSNNIAGAGIQSPITFTWMVDSKRINSEVS
jgi:hypothetical protein